MVDGVLPLGVSLNLVESNYKHSGVICSSFDREADHPYLFLVSV
jgi:hypothetical protein